MAAVALGPPGFTNEVQHQMKVLPWVDITASSASRSDARLPIFIKMGNRSAKSLQLWIARHRQSLAS